MTKELALTPTRWNMLLSIAQETYESRAFGVRRGEAAIKLLFCLEYGLPLSAANQGLYVVNGRVAAMGQIAAAELRKHPDYDYDIEHLDDKGCTIAVLRHGEKIGTASFTEQDAKRAGLLGKDVWQKYPEDMHFNRAIGRAMRRYAPDVLSLTLYTPEELSAEVDEQGGPWMVTAPEPVATTTPVPTDPRDEPGPILRHDEPVSDSPQYPTIDALLEKGWTAEQILVANEGVIPGTAEDCQRVAEKLLEGQDAT